MANRHHGHTLPDLLAALAISGTLAAGTVTTTSVLQAARAERAINFLERHVQTARSTAVHSGREVTVCASYDSAACVKRWNSDAKLLLFFDADRDKYRDVDEPLILEKQVPKGEYQLRASNRRYLRFKRSGAARDNGSWYFCAAGAEPGTLSKSARQLTVNRGGRPYRSRDRDGDGLHDNNTANGPVSCPD